MYVWVRRCGPSLWSLTMILHPSITVSAKSSSAVLVTALHSPLRLTGSTRAACLRWTVLCRGGWRKSRISRCCTWSAICVCVCVCVCVCHRVFLCVCHCSQPCGASGEGRLIRRHCAENITGAISSAALPLIGLIIILLTYCTAICILRLERPYCKLRTSFSKVFPLRAPAHPPSPSHVCLSVWVSSSVSYPGWNPHHVSVTWPFFFFSLVKTIKIIYPALVYNAAFIITGRFLTFNYRQIWLSSHDAPSCSFHAALCCLPPSSSTEAFKVYRYTEGQLDEGKFQYFLTFSCFPLLLWQVHKTWQYPKWLWWQNCLVQISR